MKRFFIYALAAVATMTACTNDGEVGDNFTTCPFNPADLTPINFGISSSAEGYIPVLAKGTGTVGDIKGENNVWKHDTVSVYMLDKGTLKTTTVYTYSGTGGELDQKSVEFFNTPVVTPDGVASGHATRVDNRNCYYPLAGSSDFWAYHLDGANIIRKAGQEKPDTLKPYIKGEEMCIDFEIDGTQDIMVAKTREKEDAQYDPGIESKYLYSAYAARKQVYPELLFHHKLARLTFTGSVYHLQYSKEASLIKISNVRADGGDRAQALEEYDEDYYKKTGEMCVNEGVYIDSIKVKSLYSGTLYFAYSDAADYNNTGHGYQRVVWKTDQEGKHKTKYLSLKQKYVDEKGHTYAGPLKRVQTVMGQTTPIGDAILLPPQDTQEEFELEVYMHQYVREFSKTYYEMHPDVPEYYMIKRMAYPQPGRTFKINLADQLKSQAFQAGTTYNINLGVSGLEMVVLDTTLEPWETAKDKDGNIIEIKKNLE